MAAKVPGERIAIESEKDLKKHAVSILRRINEDERGGLLFLINPVFALEEAGFDLSEPMRRHILHGLRYGARAKARIAELNQAVADVAGRPVDALSDEQVARLLRSRRPRPPRRPGRPSRCRPSTMRSSRP